MHTGAYGSRSRPSSKKKQPRRSRRVDADQFRTARRFSGLTREDAAELVGVSLRTIGHWETGRARPSFAAFKLLRIYRHGDLIDPRWSGYSIIRGKLVTPENHTFEPHDLSWLSLLVRRARAFTELLIERDRRGSYAARAAEAPRVAGDEAVIDSARTVRTGATSAASDSAVSIVDRSASDVDRLPFVTVSATYPPLLVGDDYSFSGFNYAHSWNGAPSSNTGSIRAGGAL